jgi:cytidylate kinase
MIIAIDGPAGSGKSTTARCLADKLNIVHINTGSMYRAIALKCINSNVDVRNQSDLEKLLGDTYIKFDDNSPESLYMDGLDVSLDIRSSRVTEFVSLVSSIKIVRETLVKYQRQIASNIDVVLEGRDIGTAVFPNADYKFFLVADIRERASRRKIELESKKINSVSLDEMILEISERDRMDSTRKYSPLKKAEDAIEIDTTGLTINQQVDSIVSIINKTNK